MVSSNGFSISVPEADSVLGQSDFASLVDGSEYSIQLTNDRRVRCDARVWIDGKAMGSFRIPAESTIRIERPSGSARKFTFLQQDSQVAKLAGVIDRADNGLIKVEFLPEEEPRYRTILDPVEKTWGTLNSYGSLSNCSARGASRSYERGATVLGDRSDQRFTSVAALEPDRSQRTVLNLRLVIAPSKYASVHSVGRLDTPYGNEEPPQLPRWTSFAHF